ncbi:Gfo/Idh/MocA family oxidoreductase [Vallitalea guaymasensis]|uniref:Gfo/Idh/MocA family oxidoreductase n=2 Tax=Vallitalea guaymasensis TaxID=1185412 RepID=A0A8J8MA13_9FIRM|nr:Gfo/Idh/MocA family oxidoreductase [Vallitalea guaymasensis]QUH28875.1 Gfo/Idh/MocA family oxidoreductase [Vallitalea guaymasensis]
MMSDKLKAGIIGCGGIANGKHMPSIKKVDQIEMVAFCDIIEERAVEASKKFGTENAKHYTDYKKMLSDNNLDVVYVCTPNREHSFITIDALEAGCHVMCEKPMAKTVKEAEEMLEAAKRTGKKLTIGYQNRFRADSQYLKKSCERGDLGDVYFAKAHAIRRRAVPTWGVFLNEEEQGGGPLIDIGTHALDLTLWCMDNYKPKRVVGTTYKKLGDQKDTGNAWGDWKQDEFTVEDSAFGFVTMENGATIILESSWALNTLETGEAKTTLCGTKAGADMKDGLRINGADLGKLYVKKPGLSADGVDFYEGDSNNPAEVEAQSFVDCIINDTEPVVKPEQALVVTKILEAIYKSAELGKEIVLD